MWKFFFCFAMVLRVDQEQMFRPSCNGKTSIFAHVFPSFHLTSTIGLLRHISRFGPPKSDVKSRVHCTSDRFHFEPNSIFQQSTSTIAILFINVGKVILNINFEQNFTKGNSGQDYKNIRTPLHYRGMCKTEFLGGLQVEKRKSFLKAPLRQPAKIWACDS